MILYIVRHAWAEQHDEAVWPGDSQRPLTEEGQQRFARVVEKLAAGGFAPELVATSPLVRCRQTAELLARGLTEQPQVVERDELVPGSDLWGMLRWTADQSDRYGEIAWVGHAPDVCRLTAAVIGDGQAEIRFAKGAVAAIQFYDTPNSGNGELRWLLTAKMLGC